MRHRPKGCTKIRITNHSNRPENGEARGRQQARYRLQTDIEAQIGAEQKHRKAIERHRKEAPQRQSLTAEAQVLGRRDWQQAKTDNRQSPITAMPATRIAVPDTRQRGTPNLHQGQKAESTHRNKAAPATYPRAPHSNRLKQPKIIYNNRYRTFF